MKVLVTGANGFLGSHLTEALIKRGYEVRCLIRKKSNTFWLKDLPVEFFYGDLRDLDSLKEALLGIDFVYHLGGVTKAAYPKLFYDVNYIGTKNLIKASVSCGVKKFLFCSSLSAVGPSMDGEPKHEDCPCEPVSDYGRSKLLAEKVLAQYMDRISVTIVRPCAIFGPRDKDILNIFRIAKKGLYFSLKDALYLFDLCYVKDIVYGIILAQESKLSEGKIFFLTGKRPYSQKEIVKALEFVFKRPIKMILLNQKLLAGISSFSTFLSKIFNVEPGKIFIPHDKILEMRQKYWIASYKRSRGTFGYEPKTDLLCGFKITYRWYRDMGWI